MSILGALQLISSYANVLNFSPTLSTVVTPISICNNGIEETI